MHRIGRFVQRLGNLTIQLAIITAGNRFVNNIGYITDRLKRIKIFFLITHVSHTFRSIFRGMPVLHARMPAVT